MNPGGARRKRHLRRQNEMVAHVLMLLRIGNSFLISVAEALRQGAKVNAREDSGADEEERADG
ncbi:MAG: hypothetical protein HRF43_12645 [Phycisphaerae bacterium]|jgi:hypothetical protein